MTMDVTFLDDGDRSLDDGVGSGDSTAPVHEVVSESAADTAVVPLDAADDSQMHADFDEDSLQVDLSDVETLRKLPSSALRFLADVANQVRIQVDAKGLLHPEEKLVVQLPQETMEAIRLGNLDFMRRKSDNKRLAILTQVEDGKRKGIKEQLAIEPEKVSMESWSQDFAQGLTNLALQQQLGEILTQLSEIKAGVGEVIENQEDQWEGNLEGAIVTILMALNDDDEQDRRDSLRDLVPFINNASGPFLKALQRRVKRFEAVPDPGWGQTPKMIFSSDYMSQKEKEYSDIQSLFHGYDTAVKAAVFVSLVLGKPSPAKALLETQRRSLGMLDLAKLGSIANIRPDIPVEGEWFNNFDQLIDYREAMLDSYLVPGASGVTLALPSPEDFTSYMEEITYELSRRHSRGDESDEGESFPGDIPEEMNQTKGRTLEELQTEEEIRRIIERHRHALKRQQMMTHEQVSPVEELEAKKKKAMANRRKNDIIIVARGVGAGIAATGLGFLVKNGIDAFRKRA